MALRKSLTSILEVKTAHGTYVRPTARVCLLEEAIGEMKENEKALFIMPSDIAFGNSGSSTGIIPPFTSVVFTVELLQVRKCDSLKTN